MPILPSPPSFSLPTLTDATSAASSATSAAYRSASSLPSVAWGAAASTASAAYAIPSAAYNAIPSTSTISNAATTAYNAIPSTSTIPAAAVEGAATIARTATNAVASIPSAATSAATSALRAGVSVVNTASAYTSTSIVGSKVRDAALGALPGVAIAGAATALSAMPGMVGVVGRVIPRMTWGRVVGVGAGAVVAATVVGAKVMHDREKEALGYLVEEGGKEDEDVGGRVGELVVGDKKGEGVDVDVDVEGGEGEVLFESEESDPNVMFEGGESVAETAGMETATLIAAAAVAHAVEEMEEKPRGIEEVEEEGTGLDRAERMDGEAGGLLRKASMSVMKSYVGDEKSAEVDEEVQYNPAAQPSTWMPWLTVGLAGAAIAAGTYYTGGLLLAAPLVQSVAVTWAASHVNEASRHLQFLYPLWGETKEEWMRRVEVLKGEVGVGRIVFRGFYIELPPLPVDETKDIKDASKKKETETMTMTTRTFIKAPPQSLCHLFFPTGSDCEDVIAAHMMMFERSVNAGGYWHMVDRTCGVVGRAVKGWRAGGEDGFVRRKVRCGVLPL
ncbi:hypothetical protein BC829DRAFT_143023 [Chytridium lagenaria]|nr:hypothetical protein BC829DRAFT_143023 [Chytridium lagenaria]